MVFVFLIVRFNTYHGWNVEKNERLFLRRTGSSRMRNLETERMRSEEKKKNSYYVSGAFVKINAGLFGFFFLLAAGLFNSPGTKHR